MGRKYNPTEVFDREPWVLVPQSLVDDRSLSPIARLIQIHGLGKPDGWKCNIESLHKEMGFHRQSIRKALDELMAKKIILWRQWREGQREQSEITFLDPAHPAEHDSVRTRPVRTRSICTDESPTEHDSVRTHLSRCGSAAERCTELIEGLEGKDLKGSKESGHLAVTATDHFQGTDAQVIDIKISEKPKATKRTFSYTDEFERWWDLYPNKVHKHLASQMWVRATKEVDPQILLDAVSVFRKLDWKKRFFGFPENWLDLDKRKWEDVDSWKEQLSEKQIKDRGYNRPSESLSPEEKDQVLAIEKSMHESTAQFLTMFRENHKSA